MTKSKLSTCPWGKLRLRSTCLECVLSCPNFFLLCIVFPFSVNDERQLSSDKLEMSLCEVTKCVHFYSLGINFTCPGGKLPGRTACSAHEPTRPWQADRVLSRPAILPVRAPADIVAIGYRLCSCHLAPRPNQTSPDTCTVLFWATAHWPHPSHNTLAPLGGGTPLNLG